MVHRRRGAGWRGAIGHTARKAATASHRPVEKGLRARVRAEFRWRVCITTPIEPNGQRHVTARRCRSRVLARPSVPMYESV